MLFAGFTTILARYETRRWEDFSSQSQSGSASETERGIPTDGANQTAHSGGTVFSGIGGVSEATAYRVSSAANAEESGVRDPVEVKDPAVGGTLPAREGQRAEIRCVAGKI